MTMRTSSSSTAPIEFKVMPTEDLFLCGSLKKVPRVTKGTEYPCQMQKNQNFSCLFRHYAKHNGLRKEDLVFYFTDELLADQTPESAHLMAYDEILVSHKSKKINEIDPLLTATVFVDQFKSLLFSESHSDIRFYFKGADEYIYAHKAILSARSQYFNAMFRRESGMKESKNSVIEINDYSKDIYSLMLEFIYSNRICNINSCSAVEIISLLTLSNEYLLDELCFLCEESAERVLNFDNIGKFMLLSHNHNSAGLRDACKKLVKTYGQDLGRDEDFRQEMLESPELGVLLLNYLVEDDNDNDQAVSPQVKRQRRADAPADSIDLSITSTSSNVSRIVTNHE